jgi:hypothetical protein
MTGDHLEAGQRVGVIPRDVLDRPIALPKRSIARVALPFADRVMLARFQETHPDILGREVVDVRARGLEDPVSTRDLGEDDAVDDDPKTLGDGLDARRARVIPHRFLARTWDDPVDRQRRRASGHSGRIGWRGHGGGLRFVPRSEAIVGRSADRRRDRDSLTAGERVPGRSAVSAALRSCLRATRWRTSRGAASPPIGRAGPARASRQVRG